MQIDDLKPGLLRDLLAWARNRFAAHPQRALAAQAHVRPRAAVKLLK